MNKILPMILMVCLFSLGLINAYNSEDLISSRKSTDLNAKENQKQIDDNGVRIDSEEIKPISHESWHLMQQVSGRAVK